jgi:hypothetical protein
MEFMIELKQFSDKVIEIACSTDNQKERLNSQLMFLAASVNTKQEFIDAIISFYESYKLFDIVDKIKLI